MNRSFEVLKDVYKPYRLTIKGKTTILETTSGQFVVKPKERELQEVYQYLRSRSFTCFPPIVDQSRDGVYVFPYIDDISMPKEQKAQDLIQVMSSLHQKTTFYKNVSLDTYQEIYENVEANIVYLKQYYEALFDQCFSDVYPSPSCSLFLCHYSKILASLEFSKRELDEWFSLVKQEAKQRVSFIHNNLSLEHYRKADQDYLISWEKSKIDSPVLDFVHFYQQEYFDLEFQTLFQKYQERFPWNEAEKKLFFILISLPKKIEFQETEFQNCKMVRECLDYIYKTEELVRPYYTVEQN